MKTRHKLFTFLVTLFAILDLSVCFTGTYAWFVTKNTVDASGIQMRIYTQDLDLTYKIYKYSDDNKCAIDATEYDDALALQEYDSVITSRNDNTPIIMEFDIRGEILNGNNTICITTHCTNTYVDTRYLSNIVGLKFAVTNDIVGNNAVDLYDSAVTYFKSVSFDTFKNGLTKNLEIEYDISNYLSFVDNGILKLYMQLDYVPALVSQFEFSFDDATTTSFMNDISLINCYVET